MDDKDEKEKDEDEEGHTRQLKSVQQLTIFNNPQY